MTCPSCNGSGVIEYRQGFRAMSKPCSMCNGTGDLGPGVCQRCDRALTGPGDVCDDCWGELEEQVRSELEEGLGRDD